LSKAAVVREGMGSSCCSKGAGVEVLVEGALLQEERKEGDREKKARETERERLVT
jgi:hypothetical protein